MENHECREWTRMPARCSVHPAVERPKGLNHSCLFEQFVVLKSPAYFFGGSIAQAPLQPNSRLKTRRFRLIHL